ncbi:FUSC family protein [Legionella sp. PATHC035]|uniref:FUSC family protein n=1 Tax=Legionella sp. PATHC035 TaxID=2992040 RepID=UPI002244F059|nr:FUSC family protein [Legionella sp. PATHC035]MCW8408091.1 FUSC family protein [Legionella sp. PATHC035]
MLTAEKLKKKLDYARFTQLAIMFMVAMWVYLFTTIPHKWWVLLTVIMVSAGIEPGLIIRRAIHRVGGTFAALLVLIPLIYLMQVNYRLIPIVFIVAIIGLAVTALNTRRYDISVFFITLVVFLLLAQTTDANSPEGPFEMVLNRGICTLIGVFIVLVGDYFLFQAYRYSQKLYLFHQMMVYNFFNDTMQQIVKCRSKKINTFIFVEQLRGQVIKHCAPIAISSENLKLEVKISAETKKRVDIFQETIWDLRRLIFALCVSEFVLHSSTTTEKYLQQFQILMKKAKDNFIYTEDIIG